MKCPKCNYLGFETGDRCKNCGYDFSLLASTEAEEVEIDLNLQVTSDAESSAPAWLDQMDRGLGEAPRPEPAEAVKDSLGIDASEPAAETAEPPPRDPPPVMAAPEAARGPGTTRQPEALPLFARGTGGADDEPLIKFPAAPRPPLSVRRTPDRPRLRAVPRPVRQVDAGPVLEFTEEPPTSAPGPDEVDREAAEASGAMARLAALVVDHLLLAAIDLAVVYFTLRMAALSMADWQALPPAPLLAFLLLLKLSYFCAFTAVGGQTIGKMAVGIQVVTEDGRPVDGARAIRRTLAGTASTAMLGLGFVPALVGSERRALHDRVARTRVVTLRSI